MAKRKLGAAELAQIVLNIRDERSVKKKAWEEQDRALKEKQEKVNAALLKFLNAKKISSYPTRNGTISITRRKFARITDPDKILAHIVETGDLGIYQQRLSTTRLQELEDAGTPVEGVDFSVERQISVTRPRRKAPKK